MNQQIVKHIHGLLVLIFGLAGCGNETASDKATGEVRLLATPAAIGSMGPNLVPGAGSAVLSWIEPSGDGSALRYSVLDDGAWGAPRTVTSGENWFVNWADFPAVVPVSESLWATHWLVRREAGGYAYDIFAAISVDAGATWSEPFNPHTDGTDTEPGFVTIFPNDGGVGMIWLDGRKMVNDVTDDVAASGMTLRAETFAAELTSTSEVLVDDLTCDCCQTDVAITADGPVAVYRDRSVNEIRDIYVSRFVAGRWQEGQAVSNDNWEIPGCPVNGPVIRATGSDVVVAWFSAGDDRPRVQAAWSADSGKSFSTPIEVSTDQPLGHVGSALLPNGDLVVSWHHNTGGGTAELNLRRVSASGELGDVYVLQEAADIFAFSVPQLLLQGDELIASWTSKIDDEYYLSSAAIPLGIL
ncbi:MAG: exo-alpha-sialidase [Gammaproteobacteria bacterium]|nr:MAG: exo-alpha-sialidase [Gammaproteobacteria bacterium]